MSLIIIGMSQHYGIALSEGRVIVQNPLTHAYSTKDGFNKTFSLYDRRIIGVQCGQMSASPANTKTVIERIIEIANTLVQNKPTAKRVAKELTDIMLPELAAAYVNGQTESVSIGLAEKGSHKKQAIIIGLNLHPLSNSHDMTLYYSNGSNPAFYFAGDKLAKKEAQDYVLSIKKDPKMTNTFLHVKRICETALKIGYQKCSIDPNTMAPVCNDQVFSSRL